MIVVYVDICIYLLQNANTKLYFTKVKRNSINQYTVNKLLTQNVYCISHDSIIFLILCKPLFYFFSTVCGQKGQLVNDLVDRY